MQRFTAGLPSGSWPRGGAATVSCICLVQCGHRWCNHCCWIRTCWLRCFRFHQAWLPFLWYVHPIKPSVYHLAFSYLCPWGTPLLLVFSIQNCPGHLLVPRLFLLLIWLPLPGKGSGNKLGGKEPEETSLRLPSHTRKQPTGIPPCSQCFACPRLAAAAAAITPTVTTAATGHLIRVFFGLQSTHA